MTRDARHQRLLSGARVSLFFLEEIMSAQKDGRALDRHGMEDAATWATMELGNIVEAHNGRRRLRALYR